MNKKASFGALLLSFSLTAAACSDSAEDDAAVEEPAVEETAEETAAPEEEAMEDDAMEDEGMEDDAMEDVGTIVDVAAEAGSFTTLLAAAEAAGLVDALSADGPLTVFAPTDEAFGNALTALGLTADELLADTETLTSILTYHVVSGEVLSTDLADGMTAATLNGAEITVDLSDGVKIDEANVVTADIKASNGVIHVIDAVLLP